MNAEAMTEIVQRALAEDVGAGDVTTRCTVSENLCVRGQIVAKERGIVAGLDVACEVYRQVDNRIIFLPRITDGCTIQVRDVLAEVSGPARGILTAERTALNFLQRLSGIATSTERYVTAVSGTRCVILDTRKTSPGLREFEKYAVTVGGGRNHRAGLYDMVLIKDNHLKIAGSIPEAVAKCRRGVTNMPLEIEVRSMDEVEDAVEAHPDRIMLDNMELQEMREAVAYIRGAVRGEERIEIEASGGIDMNNIRDVAETGVDFISVGALTHSVHALDMSFNLQ